jgi:hypothetical protein
MLFDGREGFQSVGHVNEIVDAALRDFKAVYVRFGSEADLVSSVSFVFTTNTARSLAGFVLLALALTPWRSPSRPMKSRT